MTIAPAPKRAETGHLTVLLVEDEPLLSKLVGHLLDEAGYDHVTIADHDDIPAAVARWDPHCVILDSEPRGNGIGRSWDDAAAIRRAYPELPVLMFTADVESMAEARAATSARSIAAGFSGVIDKPFLVTEFLATLQHAVEAPRAVLTPDAVGAEAITVFPALGGAAPAGWAPADFFSTAVHEMRTPLTSVLGLAQLARRYVETDPARARDAIDRTIEQGRRMERLMSELLDHARVTSGALSLQVVTFDLGPAIAAAIPRYEHGDEPRITFERMPEPVMVRGDPERIAQIIGNLLDNALKYSPPASPIAVTLSVRGADAYLGVEDKGMGIAAHERERIFAPFYRTARTRDVPGTGLGLHISRRLAEQHRGRLWLEKSTDGCVFRLALPLAIAGSATAS